MSGRRNERWTLRLSTEGADQVIRDLRAAATESAAATRALDTLTKAQPALATGAERSEQALRKNIEAMRSMRGEMGSLQTATDGLARSMGSFGAALTSPAAAIALVATGTVAAVVQVARLGDQFTETSNKLRAATGSANAATAVYAELVSLSQQTGASISESANAFVRFSVAARAIGATNGEILTLTRTVQQAGLISGASTQEAAAGVQQLGQALASGRLQGDELRSILENMPTLAEALARQLGVSIGQLRQMGSEGKLTSDTVFQALLRASEQINKQFQELTPTMGRAFSSLGQAMVDFVGKLDQALGLSQGIARAANAAAGAVGGAAGLIGPRTPAEQAEADIAASTNRLSILDGERQRIAGGNSPSAQRGLARLQQRIDAENRILAEARERRANLENQADDARQAEEASAAARRAAAARTQQTQEFNELRTTLDRRLKLSEDHQTRLRQINAAEANGTTTATEATRLRALADKELADGLKGLEGAQRDVNEQVRIYAALQRDASSGLLVATESDTKAIREFQAQIRGTDIDPEKRRRAEEDAARSSRQAMERIEAENTRTTDRITNFFGDSFARIFERTEGGFAQLMQTFKRAAISTFASIAAQAVIRPIVAPVVSALGLGQLFNSAGGLTLGGFGGVAQAADTGSVSGAMNVAGQYAGLSSAGRITGLGGAFTGGQSATGWGGIDGFLNTSVYSPTAGVGSFLPAGEQGPLLPASGGLSVGGAIGAGAGILGGAYGIYSGLQRGGIGGATTAVGGGLGAAAGIATLLGASLGPAGLIVPALLSIAGALLPGAKPSGMGQTAFENVDSGATGSVGLGGNRFSQSNLDASRGATGRIADLARSLGTALGGAQFGGSVATGTTRNTLYLDVAGRKAQFSNDEAGAKQLAETAARFVIQQFRENGRASGDYAGILNASGDNIDKLESDLKWYEEVYKAFGKSSEAASAFQQALDGVNAQFGPAIDRANELSLSTSEITKARDKELDTIRRQRDSQLANIRDSLALRDARSGGGSVAIIGGMSMRARDVAFQNEIDALEKSLKDLGVAAGEVASELDRLRRVQGQEFWKAFGETMADLDRNNIGRRLRATGRGGEADIADFDAAAARETRALSESLYSLGLSSEIVAKKVMEAEEALALERIALVKRVTEAQMASGQQIRDYLNGLATNNGAGGVSTADAFQAARQQFYAANATGGSNITQAADRLLDLAQQMFASSGGYQAIRSEVVSTLGARAASLGFATGGSFTAMGPAGNDNLSLAGVRVTAGEAVNVTRRDTMSGLLDEIRALRQEVALLRGERASDARRMVQAAERGADAAQDTATSNQAMLRSERIVGRRIA